MAEIYKKYVVTGWGYGKEEPHEPYCRACAIKKDTFNRTPQYEYIDFKDTIMLPDMHDVGEVIETVTSF